MAMNAKRPTFVELFFAGKVHSRDIDDYVALWHQTKGDEPLHAYLGLTWEQYAAWVQHPWKLVTILMEYPL